MTFVVRRRPGFLRKRTPGAKRKPKLVIPKQPPSRLVVEDGVAHFTIERQIFTPNRTLWGSPWAKKAERDSWGVAIYNALVTFLTAEGLVQSVLDTQRIANRPMPVMVNGKQVMRRLHRAVKQRYEVRFVREVPSTRHFISDDRNLNASVKHLEDALVAHCVIYDDRREWLTSPLPIQRVSEDGQFRTHVYVSPWAPPALSGRSHAASQ